MINQETLLTESTRRVGTAWPATALGPTRRMTSAQRRERFAGKALGGADFVPEAAVSRLISLNKFNSPQRADGSSRRPEHLVEFINPPGSGCTSSSRGGQSRGGGGAGELLHSVKQRRACRASADGFGAKTKWRKFWPRHRHSFAIAICLSMMAPSSVVSVSPRKSKPLSL